MAKLNKICGWIIYLTLLLLAIFFYKERTIFLDISFHVFSLINESDFAIQNFRFGAMFTQLLPLAAIKSSLSLSTILIIYSCSFVLLPFSGWLIITFICKNWKFGILMILLSLGISTHTFYWIQSEFQQGLVLLILYFAILDFNKKPISRFPDFFKSIELIIMFFLVFVHPLIIIPFSFFIVFLASVKPNKTKPYLFNLLAFSIMYILKSIFFKTQYDSKSLSGLKNFIEFFPNYFSLESNSKFIVYLFRDYYFLIFGVIFLLLCIFFNHQKKSSLIVLIYTVGLIFLANVSFPDGVEQFYMENIYVPCALFIGSAFLFIEYPSNLKSFKYFKILFNNKHYFIIAFFVLRIFNLTSSSEIYVNRLDWMRHFITENSSNKMIINSNLVPHKKLLMTWASPYEFWILSTLEFDRTESFIIDIDPQKLTWVNDRSDNFLTRWGAYKYDDLDQRYFKLLDKNSKYQIKE